MKVFCIIPAWNEEKTIANVIKEVLRYVDEVVVVDDMSSDRTAKIANDSGATVLSHVVNRGQGAALQTGNEFAISAGAGFIVHFDADGQFIASDIPAFIEILQKDEADIVFGSRFMSKKSELPWFKEHVIMPIARLVNRLLIGKSLTDPQSGFRAMTVEAATKLRIENDRMAHCSEIINKTFKYKLQVKEVSITVIYNDFGQNFFGGVRIVKDLLIAKILG